jgi:hypothetical protein
MRQLAMAVMLSAAMFPLVVSAEDWARLDGPEIVAALTSRSVVYEGGQTQDFLPDGTTLFGEEHGKWKVRGDLYCSTWPPRHSWTCYAVEVMGPDLRFIGEVGNITVGRYNDL